MAASGRTPSKISQLARDYLQYVDETSRHDIQSLIDNASSDNDDFARDERDTKIMIAFQNVINKLKDNAPNKKTLSRFIQDAVSLRKEAAQLHNQDNALLALPPEILLKIAIGEVPANQALKMLSALSRTSTFGLAFFKPELEKMKLAYFLVVEPNEDEVRRLIRANPEFLQTTIEKVVVEGRPVTNSTPYQLAHCAGDDDMCKLLKEEMVRLYNGDEVAATNEIRRQVEAKFIGIDENEDARIKAHLAGLLATVRQAITNEQFNLGRDADHKLILSPATLAAIDTFRNEFGNTQPKIIDKGMHFRSNTLQEIYDTYAQAIGQWEYHYNRCALFEDAVIALVLSCVPKNDAQRFSQGLYYLQQGEQQPEPFARSNTLRDSNNNFYDSSRLPSPDFSTLSGSCVDIVFADGPRPSGGPYGARDERFYQNLCQTKTVNLQSLCGRSNQAYRPGQ